MNEQANEKALKVIQLLEKIAITDMKEIYDILRTMNDAEITESFEKTYCNDLKELLGNLGLSLTGLAHIIKVDVGALVQEKIDQIVAYEEAQNQGK